MSRRHSAEKREVNPDPKFGNVIITKFMNSIMYDGKKSAAESIVYGALAMIEAKTKQGPLPVFEQAFDLFWRNPKLLEKLIAALLPTVFGRGGEDEQTPELPARIAQAMLPPMGLDSRPRDEDVVVAEPDATEE